MARLTTSFSHRISAKKMKRKRKALTISAVSLLVLFVVLIITSYQKALKVDNDVLKECLSSSRNYNRSIQFNLADLWISPLPHWTIYYAEVPTDVNYHNPSISVNLFGRIVDWRSKEVAMILVEKGYKDEY